jgi:hypothetical protein
MLCEEGVGCTFQSSMEINFVGCAFADDTKLIQISHHIESPDIVVFCMQCSLATNGGAIVPEESHKYIVDFQWSSGNWYYKWNKDALCALAI